MEKRNAKAWLYLLPALLFLGVFMIYPLVDVVVYSLEENFNAVQAVYTGVGLENFSHVLRDPYFLQAVKNTFLLVVITVPLSTGLALLISLGQLRQAPAPLLSDGLFPPLRDQHPGRGPGVHAAVPV